MPQTLKTDVRDRIVDAAELEFAERGYVGATMAQIAKRAGLSTGNLYRYFANKEALFEHMLGADFVEQFERLLDLRVAALARTDLASLSNEAKAADEAMLRFWFDHRLRVVVLLDRAAGSKHEGFGEHFVARLVGLTEAQLEDDLGGSISEQARFMLRQIFQTSRRAVVAILERYERESDLRAAFAAFRSYQRAGIAGFREWVKR